MIKSGIVFLFTLGLKNLIFAVAFASVVLCKTSEFSKPTTGQQTNRWKTSKFDLKEEKEVAIQFSFRFNPRRGFEWHYRD